MTAPLLIKRPRLAEVFNALGLSIEFAHWQTPFARTVLNLGGNPREIGPFEALGHFGETDPLTAWESIITHDLCPSEWKHEERIFHAAPERRRGFKSDAPIELTHTPPTLRACVTLGCDPAGIARAEELAREFCRRAHPETPQFAGTLGWRVVREPLFSRDVSSFNQSRQPLLDETPELAALLDQLRASQYGIIKLDRESLELAAPCVESCAWW